MKTKKEKKFTFDKFKVATLKNSTMKKINGGGGATNNNDNTIGSRGGCDMGDVLRIGI